MLLCCLCCFVDIPIHLMSITYKPFLNTTPNSNMSINKVTTPLALLNIPENIDMTLTCISPRQKAFWCSHPPDPIKVLCEQTCKVNKQKYFWIKFSIWFRVSFNSLYFIFSIYLCIFLLHFAVVIDDRPIMLDQITTVTTRHLGKQTGTAMSPNIWKSDNYCSPVLVLMTCLLNPKILTKR